MRLGGVTVTVINRGDPTGHNGVGDPVYGDLEFTVVSGCDIQQHRTSREINTTDVIVTRDRLFAPTSAPLLGTSVVAVGVFDGSSWPLADDDTTTVWYRVDGDPAIWNRRTGVPHHIECYLRRQSG